MATTAMAALVSRDTRAEAMAQRWTPKCAVPRRLFERCALNPSQVHHVRVGSVASSH